VAIVTQLLKVEIQSDPNALGYAALVAAKNWSGIADVLNNPANGQSTSVAYVNAQDLQNAVVASEYLALNQQQRDLWQAIITAAQGSVAINSSNIKAQALAVYTSSAAATRSNLAALQFKQASRGEVLFGIGTLVGFYDVYYAAGP
jgi:hypothetical protein